jgi:threonine dehydrogenase-like Zn-dependent dehydrogenase/transposase-like protein
MLGRLRSVLVRAGRERLAGRVEVDETSVGGEEPGLRGGRARGKKVLIGVAVEVGEPTGVGRCRMAPLADLSAGSLHPFVTAHVEPGATLITDAWQGYRGLEKAGYGHDRRSQRAAHAAGEDAGELLPAVHRVAALIKRWLLGTHQGSVDPAHLPAYLNEFVFRFNRRRSRSRGMVFYRVLELAVAHEPVRYHDLVHDPQPKAITPRPPGRRGRPPSLERPPANRPWRTGRPAGPLKWIPLNRGMNREARVRGVAGPAGGLGGPGSRASRARTTTGPRAEREMKAVTWHGTEDVRVDSVADPTIREPTDAIVRVTSTAICGSDLHLYKVLSMWLDEGDVIGHEPMGVVEAVGSEVEHVAPGDRVVVPFNIACGGCVMCDRQLYAQCETTQVREHGKGAALFGYTKLYGHVPGAQAELLRVPQAHFGPVKVPEGPPDERFLFLSDVLPTAWQAVAYADIPKGGSVTVFGLGPVGQMCARIARHQGAEQVIGVDRVPERLAMATRYGADVVDASLYRDTGDVPAAVAERTSGRGTDAVIDAVGMEAHGSPIPALAQSAAGLLPDGAGQRLTENLGVDRMTALFDAFATVRRGGTLSISGVYGGQIDPFPMLDLFDKGVALRMGQAHVKRWIPEVLPLLADEADPLGTEDLVTHRLPLSDAPRGYELFQKKEDGCIKVVLQP